MEMKRVIDAIYCEKALNRQSQGTTHERTVHEEQVQVKTALKNNGKLFKKQEEKVAVDKVMTNFNTLMNGARTERDRLIVQTMKDSFLINSKCLEMSPCHRCDLNFPSKSVMKAHKSSTHEESSCHKCDLNISSKS